MNLTVSLTLCLISFFAGTLWRGGWQPSLVMTTASLSTQCECPKVAPEVVVKDPCAEAIRHNCSQCLPQTSATPPPLKQKECPPPTVVLHESASSSNNRKEKPRFHSTLEGLVAGAARTNSKEFFQNFDAGIPYDDTSVRDVLLLYNHRASVPNHHNANITKQIVMITNNNGDDEGIPHLSPTEATVNCDLMNVVYVQRPQNQRQCLALVGHHMDASIHAKTFMRVDPRNNNDNTQRIVNKAEPLRPVGHGVRDDGTDLFHPPSLEDTQFHYQMMRFYMEHEHEILDRVRGIVEKIATKDDKTVAAITTNRGYSHLLANFVCHARARGIDLSHVLVFATDQETKELAEGLGLAAYYEEKLFASLPTQGANDFGDVFWRKIVYTQGLCAQILCKLGYNFIFQDVDVYWLRDPLEYFRNQTKDEVDIFFMEDGARWRYYAPYGANTGFYYVRANVRTRHLFTNFLSLSDNLMNRNDQSVMNMLLHLHSTQYGLHVKIVSRDEPLFLGGFHFETRKHVLKQLVTGQIHPYTYHAHWTMKKEDKLMQLGQLGMWHLKDACADATKALSHRGSANSIKLGELVGPCCSAEPLLKCYYRDMPSKEPCRDSPKKDERAPDFW